jgi:antitoxin component YwqK of YwqJK toxin-antitoxin module/CHAT domain-containing protein
MRLFVLSLLIVCSLIAKAQYPISPNVKDENGLRTGHWTIWYDSAWKQVHTIDSVIYYRLIRFEAGKPVGKVRDFYKTGIKQWDGYLFSILPDVMDGESNFYHENGKLSRKEFNKQGSLDGPCIEYSAEGNLTIKGQYKDGKAQGKWTHFYPDGTLQIELDYKDGQFHGAMQSYYPNGKMKSRAHYLNNQVDGLWENFSEDGKKTDQANYKAGKLMGPYEAYFEDGSIKEKAFFINDSKEGLWTSYHSNGKVERTGRYSHNEMDGRWTFYHANGKVLKTGLLVNGAGEGTWEYYFDNGKLSGKGPFHENHYEGDWILYYANGNVSEHNFYKRDTINGASISYYENGNKKAEGKKIMGNEDGPWKNYHENGKIKSEGNKIMGNEDGPWKYYHENGHPRTEGSFVNGVREGIWKYFTLEGVLEDTETYQSGLLHGEVISYYPNGRQKSWKEYKEGKAEGLNYSYYENGVREHVGSYLHNEKTNEWKWYHENEKLQYQLSYKRDTLHGAFIEYYLNGPKGFESVYQNGLMQGPTNRYFQDGTLKESGSYKNGLADGKWVQYDSASQKKSGEGVFINGKLNGEWVYYNSKGKVTSRLYYINGFQETKINIRDSVQHLIDREDFETALKACDWMMKVVKRDYSEGKDQTLPLSMKGKTYSAMRDYKQALLWHLRYLKQIKKYEGTLTDNYKTAVHNVASAYHGLRQFDEALAYFNEAIKAASGDGLVENYWSSVNNKAYCLFDAGKVEEAANLFDTELAKSTALYGPDSSAGWYLRHEVAEYYYDRPADYEKSYALYKALLDDIMAANQPDHELAFDCYRRMAYMTKHEFNKEAESTPFYQGAIAFAERNKKTDLPEYPEQLIELFYNYRAYHETDSVAETNYTECINKLIALPPMKNATQGTVFRVIGEYYFDQKLYTQALSSAMEAEAAAIQVGKENTLSHAAILQNMANAQLYADKSQTAKAESYFIKAIEIRKKISGTNSTRYHEAIIALASFYNSTHARDKTIALLQELRPTLIGLKDSANLADTEYYLADAYDSRNQYKEALEHYQNAWSIYSVHENRYASMCRNTLSGIAGCYKYLNDYQQAKFYAEKAIQVAERNFGAGSITHILSLTVLGDIHAYNSVYSEAIKLYTQVAAGFAKESGILDEDYHYTEYKIANSYYALNDYKKAVELAKKQVAFLDTNVGQINFSYLSLLTLLGNSSADLKEFSNAEVYKRKAVEVAGKLYGTDHPNYSIYLLSLGQFYHDRNRLEEAEKYLSNAVAVIRASEYGKRSDAESYLVALAQLKNTRDKNKEAEALFKEAFDITQRDSLTNPDTYVEAGEKLAAFYSKVGRFHNCENILLQITRFIEKKYGKKFYYAKVRSELAWNYFNTEKYDLAEKETNELLLIAEEEGGSEHWLSINLHNYLGLIAKQNKQFEKAKVQYQFCIDAYHRKPVLSEIEQSSLATMLENLAVSELCLKETGKAGEHLAEVKIIRKKSGKEENRISQIGTQFHWANYYQATGQYEKTEAEWADITRSLLQYTEENFYFMSDEEKAQFWNNTSGYFRTFHSFAIQRAKANPAIVGDMYNIQLATKAILLNASNKIKKRILTSTDSAMVNTYYRWTNQRDQLSKLYALSGIDSKTKQARIDSLKISINTLEKEMNITTEDMTADKGGQRATWKQVQASLGPQEAAIEMVRFRYYDRYVRDSVIYAALVLTAETKLAPKLVVLPNGKLLEGRALRFYKNAITVQLKDTLSYQNFWATIAPAVAGKSRLYLSLDGVYNQINLNTLLLPGGNYLVAEKNLTLLSNTKDLLALKGRRIKRMSSSTATLFGFPTFFLGKQKRNELAPARERGEAMDIAADTDRTGISPLAGTQEEINKVETILKNGRLITSSFVAEQATEAHLKKVNHPRVLHIATHGFFVDEKNKANQIDTGDDQNPLLRSGLLLTGASNFIQNQEQLEEENGILTAYEAANLNLDNTDLVVLSACETGRGEVQNGEGVYGLQRAFQTAGVQSIIMSLWKVDDIATQQLMISFYSNWMGGMSKAQALKTAQLELGKKYPHPYYWGAFVMLEN